MFLIKPLEDREKCRELYESRGFQYDDGKSHAVYSTENGRNNGICLFSLSGYNVEIIFLEYDENDVLMGDTLIRAALNYAGNRSGYIAVCRKPEYRSLLENLSFVESDGVFSATIPEIFATCKNCSGK